MSMCRLCQSTEVEMFLDLGKTPLANSLLRQEDLDKPEQTFPLQLAFCKRCSLVQILETVPPAEMFSEYLYFSSFSTTMLEHARVLAERTIAAETLRPRDLVVEIASNDGYLLQWYLQAGVPVLGVEPARNVAAAALAKGIATHVDFFGRDVARALRAAHQPAKVIHANNVLAHVPALNDVVQGMADLLASDGVVIVEAPYLKHLIDKTEFDTIYHEHLCYFSLTALDRLFRDHDLTIEDVEVLPIHGGSLRISARHRDAAHRRPSVERLLEEERGWVLDAEFYGRFSGRVESLGRELIGLLQALRADGKRICAYGAAAKGSTLLNVFGIGSSLLDFVVDRSPHKQGRYMPGVHLPIFAPEKLLAARPDHVLLLTWNHADEILAQQAEYRRLGGRFIIPVPVPSIV
jgi:SAM-dependent methyltransferase